MRKLRWTAVSAVASIALTYHAGDAAAAMMTHSDLTSLAFDADSVVRARLGKEQRVDQWTVLTDTVIEKTYKGPLAPGDHVPLDYGLYLRGGVFATEDAGPPTVAVLFLRANKDAANQRRWDAGPVYDWYIESSGVRVELRGIIQRFEQESNPGGFAPVAQGRDPYDLVNDARGTATYTWTTFEPELLAALGRAAALREAMGRAGTPEGRDALIEMLGPADPDDPELPIRSGWIGFYRDRIANEIVARIAAEKDVPRVLRALVRAHGAVELHTLREELPREEIVRVATDPAAPIEERVAAISLLGRFRSQEGKLELATVTKLLEAQEPAIRIAASHAVPPERHPALLYPQVLARQFRAEKDDLALFEEVRSAKNHELGSILTGRTLNEPLVSATRAGRVLSVGWETLHDRDLQMSRVEITATGTSQRTLSFERRQIVESRTSSSGSAVLPLAFDPPLAFGSYELACDVTLESGKGARITRHFTLAPLLAKAATPRPTYPFVAGATTSDAGTAQIIPMLASAGDAATPTASSSASATPAAVGVVSAPRPSQGCGCDVAASSSGSRGGAITSFALALLFFRRRRAARALR